MSANQSANNNTILMTVATVLLLSASGFGAIDIDMGPLFQDAFANGTATDAGTGTTVSYSGNNGVAAGFTQDATNVLAIDSPDSTSDFGAGGTETRELGEWAYGCWTVNFGNAFGPNMNNNAISATDFSLDQSSLNGGSNYYEWGMMDLHTPGSSTITAAVIENYLNNLTNYDDVNDTQIGTALGANAANDSLNMFGPSIAGGTDDDMGPFATNSATGNDGVENGNTTWDNTEFGLSPTAGITGFTFCYGLAISNTESQRSGPRASIQNLTDAMTTVPEPGSVSLLSLGLVALLGLRRRR